MIKPLNISVLHRAINAIYRSSISWAFLSLESWNPGTLEPFNPNTMTNSSGDDPENKYSEIKSVVARNAQFGYKPHCLKEKPSFSPLYQSGAGVGGQGPGVSGGKISGNYSRVRSQNEKTIPAHFVRGSRHRVNQSLFWILAPE